MTAPVVSIVADIEPLPELVATIETLLERAKSGDLRGIAFATNMADGMVGSSFEVGDSDAVRLMGALTWLSYRMAEEFDED